MALLDVADLRGGYSGSLVIKDVSVNINKGEFVGILGPNGSGKSTFLRLITKALIPSGGLIRLEEEDIKHIHLKDFSRKVAFVSQDTLINFPFTVGDIVLMGRTPHIGRLRSETTNDITIAERALSMTDSLHLKSKSIDELSAGERQRVVIAKALAQEPILLFLDEPTSHLDIGHQIQILDMLKEFNRARGLTIVIVLHDLNLASEYCSRILLLNNGTVFKDGTPDEVLTYQNIESVYKTVVVVRPNPISSRPCVFLVPGEKICRQS